MLKVSTVLVQDGYNSDWLALSRSQSGLVCAVCTLLCFTFTSILRGRYGSNILDLEVVNSERLASSSNTSG
jgi:hypothetical protein